MEYDAMILRRTAVAVIFLIVMPAASMAAEINIYCMDAKHRRSVAQIDTTAKTFVFRPDPPDGHQYFVEDGRVRNVTHDGEKVQARDFLSLSDDFIKAGRKYWQGKEFYGTELLEFDRKTGIAKGWQLGRSGVFIYRCTGQPIQNHF